MQNKKTVYLASPLGFTICGIQFLPKIINILKDQGVEVKNPWEIEKIVEVLKLEEKMQNKHDIAMCMGRLNKKQIDESDELFAILDGSDVDSGTASEIGYAFGRGKRINYGPIRGRAKITNLYLSN